MNIGKLLHTLGVIAIIFVNGIVLSQNRDPTFMELHLEIVAVAMLVIGKETKT